MLKIEHLNNVINQEVSPIRFILYYNSDYSVFNSHVSEFKKEFRESKDVIPIIEKYFGKIERAFGYATYTNKNKSMTFSGLASDYLGSLDMYYSSSIDSKKVEDFIKEIKLERDNTLSKFSIVGCTNNEFQLITRNLPNKVKIDSENSYNLNGASVHDLLKELAVDGTGLYLFTGEPGTGKSTLIKFLAQQVPNKKFVFIPNSSIYLLSKPEFAYFAVEKLNNCVLVIEDCEQALKARTSSSNYDISSILNITDGIIGDMLNLQVIATLNTSDKIDTALLRKGRLKRKVNFEKLTAEQVANLAKILNKDIKNPERMNLCDIYNTEDNNSSVQTKKSIGFDFVT